MNERNNNNRNENRIDNRNVADLIRLPFKVADRLTGPITDFIGRHLGPEMDQIVKVVPGMSMIDDMCKGFNGWVEGKALPQPQSSKPPADGVAGDDPDEGKTS